MGTEFLSFFLTWYGVFSVSFFVCIRGICVGITEVYLSPILAHALFRIFVFAVFALVFLSRDFLVYEKTFGRYQMYMYMDAIYPIHAQSHTILLIKINAQVLFPFEMEFDWF